MTDDRPKRLGFGIVARHRPGLDRLGTRVEQLRYDELWANDTPGGSGLATLAGCARGAPRIGLGVGVIPLSERGIESIGGEVERLGLSVGRLTIGLGSGRSNSLRLMGQGIPALRERLPGSRVGMAAVGPRMLRLAGEIADVVVLNWVVPARIEWARERIAEGAEGAARAAPLVAAYVRVAVGPDSEQHLAIEAERYRRSSPSYAAAFAAQQVDAATVGIACADAGDVPRRLEVYRAALDTCIIRGLPVSDDVDAWINLAEVAVSGSDAAHRRNVR